MLVQHYLRDVTLDIPSLLSHIKLPLVETSCLDSFWDKLSYYPNALMWNKYPIILTVGHIASNGLVLYICRNHCQISSRKRLHLHVPKKPIH